MINKKNKAAYIQIYIYIIYIFVSKFSKQPCNVHAHGYIIYII